jgi:hypothetical protein
LSPRLYVAGYQTDNEDLYNLETLAWQTFPQVENRCVSAREATMQATPAAQAVHKARDFKQVSRTSANSNSNNSFLDYYFRRIDPRIADSFNEEQRTAITTMFSNREAAVHAVEIRRSFPFGRKRFYLTFLLGRERRSYERLGRSGELSQGFNLFLYGGVITAWILPGILLAQLFG